MAAQLGSSVLPGSSHATANFVVVTAGPSVAAHTRYACVAATNHMHASLEAELHLIH